MIANGKIDALCGIVGPVSRETAERMLEFEALFLKWAARINLVAQSTLDNVWTRHVLDSAQIFRLAPDAEAWVDLGSGGGFPGLVIAVLRGDQRGRKIHLVESSRKKAAFLQNAISVLHLQAEVHADRVESVAGQLPTKATVSARALAPLHILLELSFPFLGRGLFHKGRDYRSEVAISRDAWAFDLIDHPSLIAPDSVILDISNVRRR